MIKFASALVVLVAVSWQVLLYVSVEPVGEASKITVNFGPNDQVQLQRTQHGVMQIWAKDWNQMFKALGFAHMKDRAVQMFLYRAISQGRLSEQFASDKETLKIDTFMRKLGFSYYSKKMLQDLDKFDTKTLHILRSYAEGVNFYLKEHKNSLPLELKLVGYEPEPWLPEDSICISQLITYVGLADTQQNAEKVIIQSIQDSEEALELMKALASPYLDNMDDELVSIIKKMKVEDEIIPPSDIPIPKLRASNNWAVSPAKSATGTSLYASDPHLNVLQLPPIWYEAVGYISETNNYIFGITLPAAPCFLMGRTKYISWGFTYGFMDFIDYFVEHCKGVTCKRGEDFVPIHKRTETILRKGDAPVEVTVYESLHGVLEIQNASKQGLEEGYYLARAIATIEFGAHDSLKALTELYEAKNVKEAQATLQIAALPTNMIIVDKENIGLQQTGHLPNRTHSGLFPQVGWDPKNDWQGRVPGELLTSYYNPDGGFIATANNMIFTAGKPRAVNLEMGSYRSDRILQLLDSKSKVSLQDCKDIQADLYALQAERFMNILRPLLPKDITSEKLANWDMRYTLNSTEATLFEEFYYKLLRTVFNHVWKNPNAWEKVVSKGFGAFFHFFDDIILEYSPKLDKLLWKGETQNQLFKRVYDSLRQETKEFPPYYATRQASMDNMLFAGKLGVIGEILGIDYGPVSLPGSRSTVCQGQYWVEDGRTLSFAPSWRFVTDLGTDVVESILPGGPSGRVFSGLYSSETEKWLNFQYKTTTLK